MAGRPPKPIIAIKTEGRSHRTKAEIEQREKAEHQLLTGERMKEYPEVKSNKIAHKEFMKLRRLLGKIGKDDALHENIMNRYALLRAECVDFEEKRENFYARLNQLGEEYNNPQEGHEPMEPAAYYKLCSQLQKNIIDLDKQVQSKRTMMLAIEKENIMTIASALRSIPKKVEDKAEDDPMTKLLKARGQA